LLLRAGHDDDHVDHHVHHDFNVDHYVYVNDDVDQHLDIHQHDATRRSTSPSGREGQGETGDDETHRDGEHDGALASSRREETETQGEQVARGSTS
jgi:hypothetical protein